VKGVVLRGRNTVAKLYFTEDGVLVSSILLWRLPITTLVISCDTDQDLSDPCFDWLFEKTSQALELEEEVEVVEL